MKIARITVDTKPNEDSGWFVYLTFEDGSMITNDPIKDAEDAKLGDMLGGPQFPKVLGPTDSYRMIALLHNLAEDLRAQGAL